MWNFISYDGLELFFCSAVEQKSPKLEILGVTQYALENTDIDV